MPDLPLILEPAADDDAGPIERLNERVFGPGRFARSAYRIRETTAADPGLSFVARVGTLMVGASAMRWSSVRSRRRRRPAGSSASWSATNPITRGWDFSSRLRAAYRVRARW